MVHKPVDRRPPARDRGYGADFEEAKKDPRYLAATHCVTCERPFQPFGKRKKTAGHVKDIRRGGTVLHGIFPQCVECNYGWRRGEKSSTMPS